MASYTLDDIREATEKKYGHTTFNLPDGDVVLLNALRLPKEKRKALEGVQKQADEADESDEDAMYEMFKESLTLVAQSEDQAKRLLDHCGDDLAMLAVVFKMYTGDTELGEASASQD